MWHNLVLPWVFQDMRIGNIAWAVGAPEWCGWCRHIGRLNGDKLRWWRRRQLWWPGGVGQPKRILGRLPLRRGGCWYERLTRSRGSSYISSSARLDLDSSQRSTQAPELTQQYVCPLNFSNGAVDRALPRILDQRSQRLQDPPQDSKLFFCDA